MMIPVTVEIYARTESFKNMSMPAYIPAPHPVKALDYLRVKKYTEAISSCSILVKYSQPTANKARLGLRSTATLLAPTSWKPQKAKSSILPTKEIWPGLSITPVNQIASLKNGMFLEKFVLVFLLLEILRKMMNLLLTISLMSTVHRWLNVYVGLKSVRGTWD